ncbi:hypothetical protein F4780DRAFT_632778 [Xylariomycetidae sp. FL0641]|nr:hypothetical protein F4780DRAFT_632778 [Xylariomycetidae sp. FL0641]
MTAEAGTGATTTPCNRCKEPAAELLELRVERVCKPCFAAYVASKTIKRLEVLQRALRPLARSSSGPGHVGTPAAAPPTPRGRPPPPQRYCVAVSGGPSSGALLAALAARLQRRRRANFVVVVCHVWDDSSCSAAAAAPPRTPSGQPPPPELVTRLRAQLPPSVPVHALPLSAALALVDLSQVPSLETGAEAAAEEKEDEETTPAARRLADLLARLPSPTSRADVRRFLTRHLLLAFAAGGAGVGGVGREVAGEEKGEGEGEGDTSSSSSSSTTTEKCCDALLLGTSTTGLAAAALAETAKGRGWAVPALVGDGAARVPSSFSSSRSPPTQSAPAPTTSSSSIPVYMPQRELFRAEQIRYLVSCTPGSLASVFLPPSSSSSSSQPNTTTTTAGKPAAVVSHRDQSIDDVLARYFAEVEAAYPSVVANVVRTAGKLARPGNVAAGGRAEGRGGHGEEEEGDEEEEEQVCGLCGLSRDELGDERWRGELGEVGPAAAAGAEEEEKSDGERAREGRKKKKKLCYGCERAVRG